MVLLGELEMLKDKHNPVLTKCESMLIPMELWRITSAQAVGAGITAMANEYANAARELQTFASISNTTTQEFQKMAVGAERLWGPLQKN